MDWIKENTENTEFEPELPEELKNSDFLQDMDELPGSPEPEKTEVPFTKAPPRPEIVVTAPWPQEILSPEEEEWEEEEEEEEPEYHGSGARRLLVGVVAVLAIVALIVFLLYGVLFDGFSENLNFASLLSCFEVLKCP